MDINTMREIVTVLSFLAFLAILAHALRPSNAERFEKAARLPLDDDQPFIEGQEGR
jgi:cbb3-type cytochrome oxidase subunit 3